MPSPLILLGSLLALGMLAGPANAQQLPLLPVDSPPASDRRCFHPRPLSSCASFLITEFGFASGRQNRSSAAESHLLWEFGYMRNTSERTAKGGSLLLGLGEHRVRVGAKARYRYWLAPEVPVDLAPGVLLYGPYGDFSEDLSVGLTGHAGVSLWDVAGVFVQVDVVEGRGGYVPELQLGGRLGTVAGAVTGVVLPLAVMGILATWSGY